MGGDGIDTDKGAVFAVCNVVATQICCNKSKFGERARSAKFFVGIVNQRYDTKIPRGLKPIA